MVSGSRAALRRVRSRAKRATKSPPCINATTRPTSIGSVPKGAAATASRTPTEISISAGSHNWKFGGSVQYFPTHEWAASNPGTWTFGADQLFDPLNPSVLVPGVISRGFDGDVGRIHGGGVPALAAQQAGGGFGALFLSHPPIEQRIAALEAELQKTTAKLQELQKQGGGAAGKAGQILSPEQQQAQAP